MTTSTTTSAPTNLTISPGIVLLPWINRGLEGLWLLAVFLVPLIFLNQGYVISEAQISYVEVPKVALLRTVAGLIALLWTLEWAIKSHALDDPFHPVSIPTLAAKLRPSKLAASLKIWLVVHTTRWLLLAVGLFFGSIFLSTVLSGSFITSMWGEIPGQDGYSAYTMASYGILFSVIATHLNNRAQLDRLLAAVVTMGVLVGLYGILQHFGHDFFNLTESTGGGTLRVSIFMGNAIFAAAVLSMTVPITLVAAAINLRNEPQVNCASFSKLRHLGRDSVLTYLWALTLAVQLLGLTFTFSRGAWGGAVLALVVFLGLVVISLGWRMLIRTSLVLGLAGILSVAFLHWQGSVLIVNVGSWLGIALTVLGLGGTSVALYIAQKSSKAIILLAVVGVALTLVGGAVLAPSALSGRTADDSTTAFAGGGSTTSQVTGRISSIKTEVLSGFVSGRTTHWKVSWTLIKNRPWFEFDDLSLSWLRPLIGYGPDLFRYTYLLESPPDDFHFHPLEPDHAHNYFIHQTVEQGILGGLASLAIFASVFGVVAHHLIRNRKTGNLVYRLLLFGLMSVTLGRFMEMMVGVARISDLTVLWVLFALFISLMKFDDVHQDVTAPHPSTPTKDTNRNNLRRAPEASSAWSFSRGMILRLAIVAFLVGGIGVVTWQKSINYVRASVAEGQALKLFQEGDLERTIEELDKAIKLAPGIPSYHNNRSQVFLAYQLRPDVLTEPDCVRQSKSGKDYLVCLRVKSLESNIDSIEQQPFNYRSRLAAANSAYNLQRADIAVEFYSTASKMVPNSWSIRNELAESLIDAGFLEEAIAELDWSLEVTGGSDDSTPATILYERALRELGRIDGATE